MLANFIGGALAVVLLVVILLLAKTSTRKWLFGLILVPLVYVCVAAVMAPLFMVLTVGTVGLPLLICQPFM